MRINIVRPFLPTLDEIETQFDECLKSGMVSNNSQYVRKFEDRLQNFFSSNNKPVLFSNGEMALFHLLQAYKARLGFREFETFDVLLPSFTFPGTANAVIMNNLKPVFCDVDHSLTIDVNKIDTINKDIKMIIGVGVFGNLPNIEKLGEFAELNQLNLIFDNAPAFGATRRGKFTNNFGFSEIFSFHVTKLFSSMEGGVAITNDIEIEKDLRKLKDFGQFEKVRGNVDLPGLNSKMQEISAIVGLKNLEKIEFILSSRKRNIEKYKAFFLNLEQKDFIRNMVVDDRTFCTYLYYPIILNEGATNFVNYMVEKGIGVRRYYTAVHDLKLYKNKYEELDLSYTNQIKDNIVALPLHTLMQDVEIEYLFKTVEAYFK